MGKARGVFVNIYVFVWGGCFPKNFTNRKATGQEIYRFLMMDARMVWCDNMHQLLSGDPVIWYLGLGDGYGCLGFENRIWTWDKGEASFTIVEEFITALFVTGILDFAQYQALWEKAAEGRTIPNMHGIYKHLKNKQARKPLELPTVSDHRDMAA